MPPNFAFTRGDLSGTLMASADSLAGAGSYELHTGLGDPAVEADWKDQGTFLHGSHIPANGCTPGSICYARFRGVGTTSPGLWAV